MASMYVPGGVIIIVSLSLPISAFLCAMAWPASSKLCIVHVVWTCDLVNKWGESELFSEVAFEEVSGKLLVHI